MNSSTMKFTFIRFILIFGSLSTSAVGEPLRHIKVGDPIPSYQLTTMDGTMVDSDQTENKVMVLIYIVARQRGSEHAITEANKIIRDLKDHPVELLIVTANIDQMPYLEKFWSDQSIQTPLAFDPDRKLYAELGLIAFPSTLIIDRQGRLAHAISTHSPNYPHLLEGYTRHTLGLIDDTGLEEHLKIRSQQLSSPKDLSSRHRTVARLMRGKGLLAAAEDELHEALKLDPGNTDTLLDLADLYLQVKRIDEAEKLINQVLETNAEHRRGMLLKGILLFRQSNFDQAEAILNDALILNPNPARTHFYLGRIHEAKGNTDRALYHYHQALERLLDEPIDRIEPDSNRESTP